MIATRTPVANVDSFCLGPLERHGEDADAFPPRAIVAGAQGLRAPAGTRGRRRPLVARAKYYNFQLWHDGKVLSRWPQKSRVELRRRWHFAGRSHTLVPGRYDWYVWPHYNGRYHARLGHAVFYVRAN